LLPLTDVAMLLGAELGLSPAAQHAQVTAYRTRVADAEWTGSVPHDEARGTPWPTT
jgi:hypothetical protein